MAMSFRFNIKNDPGNWNPGTVYFYNGSINEVQGIHNGEEHKYIQDVYKECTGLELKGYIWDAKVAPVYVRLFGTLQPGSQTGEIKRALDKIYEQLEKAVD